MIDGGRILQRTSPEGAADDEVQRTISDLSAEVAVPVLDQERLLGVAFLDRKVSGLGFAERELSQLFSVFEVFGLALRNSRKHVAVGKSEELSCGVLDSLTSGCVVVGPGHEILHANPALHELFGLAEGFTIRELPQVIGSRVFAAVDGDGSLDRFRHETSGQDKRLYDVVLRRIPHPHGRARHAILAVFEDVTERERSQQAELAEVTGRLDSFDGRASRPRNWQYARALVDRSTADGQWCRGCGNAEGIGGCVCGQCETDHPSDHADAVPLTGRLATTG